MQQYLHTLFLIKLLLRFVALMAFVILTMSAAVTLPVFAKQNHGEGCSAFKPCGDGLSCQPFIQKCYHKPRKQDEPCMAGHGCAAGLTCEAGKQICVGPGRDGEACHLTKPCGEGLTCMPGSQKCAAGARPIVGANDFPPPAAAKSSTQRLAECDLSRDPKCYRSVEIAKTAGVTTNCLYGRNVGAGHPNSNTSPPDYALLLNALDQCAYFHDRGAWQYNRNTKTCEHWTSCSNSMGLMRCMERFKPRNKDEADAKACFIDNFKAPMKSCIPALYPDWGADFATTADGEQWLSAKSISELRGAMKQCPGNMNSPGFTP
jgi:hypothetical protein